MSAYAWLLHHNAIGVDYGVGYRREESLAATRRAIGLDPADLDLRRSLSDALRHDRNGIAYTSDSELEQSIEQLEYVQANQHPVAPDVSNNLAIELFYDGQYQQALDQARGHPPTPTLDGIDLAALAVTQGAAVAIQTAAKLADDTQRRDSALQAAADSLWNMRFYPEAAALLEAGLPDGDANAGDLQKVQIFRSLKPYRTPDLPPGDPRISIRSLLAGALGGTLTPANFNALLVSSASATPEARQESLRELLGLEGIRRNLSVQTGLPTRVVVDLIMRNLTLRVRTTDDSVLARVDAQVLGGKIIHFLLLKEDRAYRIAAISGGSSSVGGEALLLLRKGQLAQAGAILDWTRELTESAAEEDPIGGSLFARLWTIGQIPDVASIETAAAALMTHSPSAAALLPDLTGFRDSADGRRKDVISRLMVEIFLARADGHAAEAAVAPLLNNYPASPTAVRLAGRAFALDQNWPAWKAMLASRMAEKPTDPDWMRQQAAEQAAEGRYADARRSYHSLAETGRAKPEDDNMEAWLSLFDTHSDSDAREQAQRATGVQRPSAKALQTLACVEAMLGDAAEARQTLARAMLAANLAEPDDSIWLAYGLLYQQYGEKQAAIKAFSRIAKPSGELDPTGIYALAEMHRKQLQ